jgi:DNA-binding NtrC family response regulator
LDTCDFDLIFSDIILENKTGIDILREIREKDIKCPVVLITGYPDVNSALNALRLGVFDYIVKPVLKETLFQVTNVALQHKALMDEKEKCRLNLEAIFRSVKDALITVSADMTILETNDASESICNLSRDGVGKPFDSLQKYCDGKCLDALKETVEKKVPVEFSRIECKHKLRQHQVVTITTYPLQDNKGVFSGAVLVVRDETHLAELERDMKERHQFHNIIGKSDRMEEIYALVEDLSEVQTTVLIVGESGTGKELVAEALHYNGNRSHKPFVKVNCSALSENLLESELFGHVKGAFTGAVQDRVGRFQKADGGTIFLDEIGDISPRTQLQLLRVLQEREFERVGDSTPIKVDVRVVAATNQNLEEKIRRGEFREDLYYRLKVVEIRMPPLRERGEDIPLLVEHFLEKFNKKLSKDIVSVSSDVQKIFMEYPWPGNIRELEHTMEHAFVLCRQKTITVDDLPFVFRKTDGENIPLPVNPKYDERREIISVLEKTGWNRMKAARLLGMSRSTIYRKIMEYKIEEKD